MKLSIDKLREDANKTFTGVELELDDETTVYLRNILRLPEKDQIEFYRMLAVLFAAARDEEKDEERKPTPYDEMSPYELGIKALTLLLDDKTAAKKLTKALPDLGLVVMVLNSWVEATGLGEAESSRNESTGSEAS